MLPLSKLILSIVTPTLLLWSQIGTSRAGDNDYPKYDINIGFGQHFLPVGGIMPGNVLQLNIFVEYEVCGKTKQT